MAIVSDDIKVRVQQATDLVRLIGEHVALRPRGREFIGLCPFHDDKNPSMYVSPAKQIYKCFSCGAGGDAFSFMMGYHKMTFPEALKHLAERAGIVIPEFQPAHTDADHGDSTLDRTALLQASNHACSFYQTVLRHREHGQSTRDYITHRHINSAMVDAFQLGYAPDRWDGLMLTITDKNWRLPAFEKLGLVSRRTTGDGYYDRFRNRLMFPICDSLGRVIAFGGRKLREEDEPKYLNSPESTLFNKSATLYGLHLAKKTIIQQRTAVVVEGYTDVIACHQHGITNVVATLGTALTSQHVVELRRYCDKVILIYDGDEAGVKAADRALEIFLTGGLDVAIAIIPDELDPGDLFELPDGVERWQKVIASATDALEFQFDRTREQLEAISTVTGRQKLVEDYLRRLAQMGMGQLSQLSVLGGVQAGGAMVRRTMVLTKLSQLLRVDQSVVSEMLNRFTPPPRATDRTTGAMETFGGMKDIKKEADVSELVALGESEASISALRVAERQIIGCLLHQPDLFHQVYLDGRSLDEALAPPEMPTTLGRALYQRIYDTLAEGKTLTLAGLCAELSEAQAEDQKRLAIDAGAEIERVCGDDPQRCQDLLTGSVRAIMAYHRRQNYFHWRQSKATDSSQIEHALGVDAPTHEPKGDKDLRQVMEHLATPSMRRMPRVRKA